MRTEVYSWRLSGELKSDLEREARLRKVPVSAVLETAVRDWLKNSEADAPEDEAQRKLHTAADNCFGVLSSGNSRRAETARETLRDKLRGTIGRRLRRRNGR
jgi:post-segregation antitoxin (ccd killing protein)